MPADRLSATLAALADPTRRAILARLARGETAVGELARPFDMTLPAISKHLKVLERAGLIARGRDAQRRPCRLQAAPLREVSDWVTNYRQFWDERLDRLEAYLQKAQARKGKGHARKAKGGACRRPCVHPDAHAERAAQAGVPCLRRARPDASLVGAQRLHHAVLQARSARGRAVADDHPRRRHGLGPDGGRRLSRDSRTRA